MAHDTSLAASVEATARRIAAAVPPDVLTPTLAPALTLYAWSGFDLHTHIVYRPSLCAVFRGTKHARAGERSYRYDAGSFFFTAVPMPAELEVRRARGSAVVGLVLELDMELVARVALDIDDALASADGLDQPSSASVLAFTGVSSERLVSALDRLVEVALDPIRHHVLHDATLREVLFELLVGPHGPALRAAVRRHGNLRALIDVVRFLDDHSHEAIRIPGLARRAGMSQSSFFDHFREATGASPLQYLKALRLTKARVMLAAGTSSVTDVALSVGYASSSQFSRDFRRSFGCAPSELKSR